MAKATAETIQYMINEARKRGIQPISAWILRDSDGDFFVCEYGDKFRKFKIEEVEEIAKS